jgi:hypothetical protein
MQQEEKVELNSTVDQASWKWKYLIYTENKYLEHDLV